MRVQLLRVGLAVVAFSGIVAGVAFGAGQGYPGDHAELAIGSVWLASDATGQLTLVNGASVAVSAQVTVGPVDTRLEVAQSGSAGYASLPTGEVARIDATTWGTVRSDVSSGPTSPLLFPSGDLIYAVDTDTGRLGAFNGRTLATHGAGTQLPAPVQPHSIAVDDTGRLWAYDAGAGTVIPVDAGTRAIPAKVAPPGIGLMAVAAGHPVAVVPGAGLVTVLDPDTGSPQRAIAVDAPADGTVSIAAAPDRQRLVLTVGSRGTLVVCDLDRSTGCGTSIAITPAGDELGTPVVVADRAYVPDFTTGRVTVVDLTASRVVAQPQTMRGPKPFQVVTRDGFVFYNDPDSALAGLILPDATLRPLAKYWSPEPSASASASPSASPTPAPTTAAPTTPPATRSAGPTVAPVATTPAATRAPGCATWSTVDMPTPSGQATRFADVSGRWAVGRQGDTQIIERWNGSTWSVDATPATAGPSALTGVSAPNDNTAWAVGSTTPAGGPTQTLTERFDGTAWQVVPSPSDRGTVLNGVWATGADAAWAVGADDDGPLALLWNGSAWREMPSPGVFGLSALTAVSGTGPDDVWAVGTAGSSSRHRAVLAHWDGDNWRISATPDGVDVSVVSVRALAPDDVWAVGQYTPGGSGAAQPYALHWDGRSWQGTAFPGLGAGINRLNDVVPSSTKDVWLIGGRNATTIAGSGRAAVEHWDGTAWQASTGGLDGVAGASLLRAVPLGDGRVLAIGAINTSAGDRPISAIGSCDTR